MVKSSKIQTSLLFNTDKDKIGKNIAKWLYFSPLFKTFSVDCFFENIITTNHVYPLIFKIIGVCRFGKIYN